MSVNPLPWTNLLFSSLNLRILKSPSNGGFSVWTMEDSLTGNCPLSPHVLAHILLLERTVSTIFIKNISYCRKLPHLKADHIKLFHLNTRKDPIRSASRGQPVPGKVLVWFDLSKEFIWIFFLYCFLETHKISLELTMLHHLVLHCSLSLFCIFFWARNSYIWTAKGDWDLQLYCQVTNTYVTY